MKLRITSLFVLAISLMVALNPKGQALIYRAYRNAYRIYAYDPVLHEGSTWNSNAPTRLVISTDSMSGDPLIQQLVEGEFQTQQVFSQSSKSTTRSIVIQDKEFVLREQTDPYPFALITTSRNVRYWNQSQRFSEAGKVAKPIALIRTVTKRGIKTALLLPFAGKSLYSMRTQNPKGYIEQLSVLQGQFHERQLCHGDLKLDNILVDTNGNLVLIDLDNALSFPNHSWVYQQAKRRDHRKFTMMKKVLKETHCHQIDANSQ